MIQWESKYETGVEEIDNQHKKLVGMINELYSAIKSGEGKKVLDKILQELASYVDIHFGTEEKYMEEFNYPGYLSHKREHDNFTEKVLASRKTITL